MGRGEDQQKAKEEKLSQMFNLLVYALFPQGTYEKGSLIPSLQGTRRVEQDSPELRWTLWGADWRQRTGRACCARDVKVRATMSLSGARQDGLSALLSHTQPMGRKGLGDKNPGLREENRVLIRSTLPSTSLGRRQFSSNPDRYTGPRKSDAAMKFDKTRKARAFFHNDLIHKVDSHSFANLIYAKPPVTRDRLYHLPLNRFLL